MQKKNKAAKHLKVSLHGMNGRAYKMTTRFLELSCKGYARVVDESESEVEIIDIDLTNSKSLLEERLAHQPSKPIIALSLWNVSLKEVLYVKKPIESSALLNAFKQAKKNLKQINRPILKKPDSDNNPQKPKEKDLEQKSHSPSKLESPPPVKAKPTVTPAHVPKNSFASHISELNKVLKTLNNPSVKHGSSPSESSSFLKKNIRKSIRYSFRSISAKLSKSSLVNLNSLLEIQVLNTSGNDALIKLKNPSKLDGKVTLIIQSESDTKHDFVIPARITRKESPEIYGLEFLDHHPKLIDSLFDTQHAELYTIKPKESLDTASQ